MPIIHQNILGKKKVRFAAAIIIYSFMAEHYPIVYTTTFSAGEFEAWFILDKLLHYQPVLQPKLKRKEKSQVTNSTNTDEISEENDEESNRLHSTDQHGINYINSAICYLLGIEFQRQRPTVTF